MRTIDNILLGMRSSHRAGLPALTRHASLANQLQDLLLTTAALEPLNITAADRRAFGLVAGNRPSPGQVYWGLGHFVWKLVFTSSQAPLLRRS
jgi:hypothetical protein